MAKQLLDCLRMGHRPSMGIMINFGIEEKRHFLALQDAMIHGVTAYDLDRVLGDGPAITCLVNGTVGKYQTPITFTTAYDGLVSELLWGASK